MAPKAHPNLQGPVSPLWQVRSPSNDPARQPVRPEAKDAVEQLKDLGLRRQLVVTGDTEREARKVAAEIDLTEVHAEALPAEKMQFVLDEVRKGHRPMVVGDGINDALALKAGAVGVAMGAHGADVALASADLV
jgi:P-type E1-E2 ATPase